MIGDKTVLALIPARGGSKGLPRKNLRIVASLPLVAWPIKAALKSEYVDKVVCSTDDEEIASLASAAGAAVPFIRPAELASDQASSMDVIEHALDFLESRGEVFDYLILLEPTSPMTEAIDINAALERLEANTAQAEAIVGISKLEHTHPDFNVVLDEGGIISPALVEDFTKLGRRQELNEVFILDGSFYLSKVDAFRKYKSFYHERTLGHIMPRWKSFEIDDYVDLICVEAILCNKHRILNQA